MKDRLIKFIKELIPYIVILVVVVVIRSYLVTPILVNGTSMSPTLDGGEIMILNKVRKYDRYDIVVIKAKSDKYRINEDLIKRVIALPGESISCENGIIYVNDRKIEENFGKGYTGDFERIVLKDDEYFCLGDNRSNSLDSEELGPFKKKDIKGTARLVLFPFNKIGNVK